MGIKHDNFVRISETRVSKIVDLISKLNNLNNRSYYDFTPEEANKMFEEIQRELDKQKMEFKKLENNYRFEL